MIIERMEHVQREPTYTVFGGDRRVVTGALEEMLRKSGVTEFIYVGCDMHDVLRRALEAANRSKDLFVANTGHELRTPLAALIGTARLLEEMLPFVDGLNVPLYTDQPGLLAGPRCSREHLQSRGYAYTTTSRYKRWQCQSCKGWLRSKRSEATSETRSL